MTAGMTLTSLVFHDVYPSLTMMKVLLPFEIAMVLLCGTVMVRYFSPAMIFGPVHKPALGWMAPLYLALVVAWVAIFLALREKSVAPDAWSAFMITGIVTLLVGISEELMFRGIILQALLKSGSAQRAVLISALAFSSLHAINIIAHHSWLMMAGQLAMTFIFGLFSAAVTIRLRNLLPMIVFHWLWDFQAFVPTVMPVPPLLYISGTIVLELVMGIVLWKGLRNYKPA